MPSKESRRQNCAHPRRRLAAACPGVFDGETTYAGNVARCPPRQPRSIKTGTQRGGHTGTHRHASSLTSLLNKGVHKLQTNKVTFKVNADKDTQRTCCVCPDGRGERPPHPSVLLGSSLDLLLSGNLMPACLNLHPFPPHPISELIPGRFCLKQNK